MNSHIFYAALVLLPFSYPALGQIPRTAKPLLDSPPVTAIFDFLIGRDNPKVVNAILELNKLGNNPRIPDRIILLGLSNIINGIFVQEKNLVIVPKQLITIQDQIVIQSDHAAVLWRTRPNRLTGKVDEVAADNALRKADGARKEIERIKALIHQQQPKLIDSLKSANTAAVQYRQAECISTAVMLASCIHVINDRSVEPEAYTPTFSKRWIQLKRMTPQELVTTRAAATAQIVAALVGRFKIAKFKPENTAVEAIKPFAQVWVEQKLDDALFTFFIDLQDVAQPKVRDFLIEVAEEGLSDRTIAASEDRNQLVKWLEKHDPDIVKIPALTDSVFRVLLDAVRQGVAAK